MGEQELTELLKKHGWTLGKQRTHNQHAYSAKKYSRVKCKNITRYIAVTSTLGKLTEADVLGKLKE